MTNADLVAAKLVELADRVGRARTHCPPTTAALAADRDALDLVAFNLMLAVQTCSDIAAHIVADEGWAASKEARGLFERLGEHGVVSADTVRALARAVGLRNVVAHGYAGVDPAMVHAAASRGLPDLERFAAEIAGWLVSSR